MTSLDAHRQGEPLLYEDRFRSAYLLSLNMTIQLHNESQRSLNDRLYRLHRGHNG